MEKFSRYILLYHGKILHLLTLLCVEIKTDINNQMQHNIVIK